MVLMSVDNAVQDSLLGRIINRKYKILDQVGQGGMGKVYKAEQLPLGRIVAIKTVRAVTERDDEATRLGAFEKRFFLEASTLARLQHPNLVSVFDYGEIAGSETPTYFMAMEYLSGETLHRRIRRKQRLDASTVLSISQQIAKGLRQAHAQGIVHRDLKPGNVMLVPEDKDHEIAKVLDFGLVKVLASDQEELTQAGTLLGSPTYIAPEQVRGLPFDARADLYSLGIVMYEMLAGIPPFKGSAVELFLAHVNQTPPGFAARIAGLVVPPSLERIVMKCLEKDPSFRYQAVDDLLQELKECDSLLDTTPVGVTSDLESDRLAHPIDAHVSGSAHTPASGVVRASGRYSAAEIPPSDEPTLPDRPTRTSSSSLPLVTSLHERSALQRVSDMTFYTLLAFGSVALVGATFLLLTLFAHR